MSGKKIKISCNLYFLCNDLETYILINKQNRRVHQVKLSIRIWSTKRNYTCFFMGGGQWPTKKSNGNCTKKSIQEIKKMFDELFLWYWFIISIVNFYSKIILFLDQHWEFALKRCYVQKSVLFFVNLKVKLWSQSCADLGINFVPFRHPVVVIPCRQWLGSI